MSSFITGEKKGSLTIETALVLPVFIFAMVLLLTLSNALDLYMVVAGAMHQNVKRAAQMSYMQDEEEQALYDRILYDIGTAYLDRAPVKNGSEGLSLTKGCYAGADIISIQADYSLELPFDLFGIGSVPIRQVCTAHKWVGYGGGLQTNLPTGEEEYVYITPHGTVYHRSADCTHIRLSIREVEGSEIRKLRNTDGSKYKRCEYCHCSLSAEHIYITNSGDRYHNSLTCSGLKRDVIAIPISEAGSRRPCSRCGGSH